MNEHTASGEDASRDSRRRETDRLFRERRRAGARERRDLLDEVVCLNMEVARDLARRYRGRGVPDDDLEQVAYLGLVKAVRGFDVDRADDFLSYAVPTIRGEVRRYFRDHGWMVRPSRTIQELQAKINRAQEELAQRLGRPARPGDLAAHLGVEESRVTEALAASGCFTPLSLSAERGLGTSLLLDTLGSEDPDLAAAEVRTMLHPLLVSMSCRERELVRLRFVQGLTQAEVGQEIGVTQSQVSRMLSDLLAKMRSALVPAAAA